jgi:hypothetical protein
MATSAHTVITLAICLLASACTITPTDNPHRAQDFNAASFELTSGLVVLSTAVYGGPCSAAAGRLRLGRAGSAYDEPLIAFTMDSPYVISDFSDHAGTLNVVTLEAGDYHVYPTPHASVLLPQQVPMARFTVNAGDMLYLGEFLASSPCINQGFTTSGEFRDQSARDLALIGERNPQLAAKHFVRRVLSYDGFIVGAKRN